MPPSPILAHSSITSGFVSHSTHESIHHTDSCRTLTWPKGQLFELHRIFWYSFIDPCLEMFSYRRNEMLRKKSAPLWQEVYREWSDLTLFYTRKLLWKIFICAQGFTSEEDYQHLTDDKHRVFGFFSSLCELLIIIIWYEKCIHIPIGKPFPLVQPY